MSNDTQKADQIAYHFYTKLTLVVHDARATADQEGTHKSDKWFNLETPDVDVCRDSLRMYRSLSSSSLPPPTFELQVLLAIPDLAHNQVLVHLSPDSTRLRIEPTPKFILLESWLLAFAPAEPHPVAPPTIYKHGIPLFRSLYSLLRILPTWKLFKRLRRRARNGNLSIQLRARAGQTDTVHGFDDPPAHNAPPLPRSTHIFPAVPHPTGTLTLYTTYLASSNFQLDELESHLSSRFLSLDDGGPDFTPTLAKNMQRDSLSIPANTPGSLPVRISLPRSKSPTSSVVDRFVLPPQPLHTRTASLPGSPRQPSGLAARLRKESTGADLPGAPVPLPIRRPNINPVHPFKASTLSSGSPSHRQASPLSSVGPGLPRASTGTGTVTVTGTGTGSSTRARPSPSSLGGEKETGGRKRYSSSFGHRYAATGGAGSEGGGSASFLSTNTDDDDISAFVQDIDARKPLGRLRQQQQEGNPGIDVVHDERETGRTVGEGSSTIKGSRGNTVGSEGNSSGSSRRASVAVHGDSRSGAERVQGGASGSGSGEGPMLTNESDVDERLREMNAAFRASLEGLGSSNTARRRQEIASSEEVGSGRGRDRARV